MATGENDEKTSRSDKGERHLLVDIAFNNAFFDSLCIRAAEEGRGRNTQLYQV